MSASTVCWWCRGRLVGPGGVKGKEPLFYREVEIQPGQKVRVHVVCENDAKASLLRITAAPKGQE